MNKVSLFIPLGVFAVIVIVGYLGFSITNKNELPSALIDQPFPQFSAKSLLQPNTQVSRENIVGKPALVNVWATWCPTCKAEHEQLVEIAAISDVVLIGINYKDQSAKALAWLAEYGNPYDLVISDDDGSLGVELGVYGAPETFMLDSLGRIVYKRVGDVNPRIWQQEIAPRLLQLGVTIRGSAGAP